jgi:hypothetical protein
VPHPGLEKSSTSEKLIQLAIHAGCVSSLVVGWWLQPNPAGVGTHTSLGFPPCGFYAVTGVPCPTCGVTTAFVLGAHLQLVQSFFVQPFGFLVFVAVCATALTVILFLLTGRSVFKLKLKVNAYKIAISLIAFVVVSWGYKITLTLLKR